MSNNTTTPDNPSTTEHDEERPHGDNRPATDRTATASDHLWAALHARPGGTTEELSTDAGIGRSTAAKILARWVADGTAVRVPTGGKRSTSRYAVPAQGDSPTADSTDDAATVTSDPDAAPVTKPQHVGPATDDAMDADDEPDGGADPARDEHHPVTTTNDAPDRDPAEEGTTTRPPVASPAAGEVDANTPNTTGPATDVDADANTPPDGADGGGDSTDGARAVTPGRGARLASGALHGMVEDYLRDHPGEEFGPTKIGHDLARSTGAVGNALERLVASGYAIRTKDRPKRYALAPTGSTGDDPEPPGNREA